MSNPSEINRMNYSITKHHKENLRDQIDPRVIEKIEVHEQPSLNYKNAFKSVYYDELQKTILYHQQKKRNERETYHLYNNCNSSPNYSNSKYYMSGGPIKTESSEVNNSFVSTGKLNNSQFIDYDQQKNFKVDRHVLGNYDGGQSFFKQHDSYLKKKEMQESNTKNTLMNQMNMKENLKIEQHQRISYEQQSQRLNNLRQVQVQNLKNEESKNDMKIYRGKMINQMEEERQKRHKKSIFQYNSMSRHNPITNPIEYHIDNPYILSKISNQQIYRND